MTNKSSGIQPVVFGALAIVFGVWGGLIFCGEIRFYILFFPEITVSSVENPTETAMLCWIVAAILAVGASILEKLPRL